MRFSIYQESRIGARRSNQDRMGYLYTRHSLLMLLADGMGGHTRGDLAAQTALQVFATRYQRERNGHLAQPAQFLREGALAAHRELHRLRAEQRLPEAPRTTLIACVIQGGVATWAHVGDSRLYLIRRGRIAQRTVDHSRVHQLVMAGVIKPEEARSHPERNLLLNCLGGNAMPTVEIGGPIALHHADTVLLCSDGLWAGLTDRELAQAFSNTTVMRAVPALMDRALESSGAEADNCTALAMTWAGSESLDMVPPTDSPVSTLAVPAGTVASTLQIAAQDELEGDGGLTDEQIDHAVREIRRAIRRSAKLVDGDL